MISDAFVEQIRRFAARKRQPKLVDLLVAEARECAHISNADGLSPIGGSRLGGLPDLPPAAEWPRGRTDAGLGDLYADFLAQINFAEIPPIRGLSLPRTGHLRLFMTSAGLNCMDLPFAAITDFNDVVELQPRDLPSGSELVCERLTERSSAIRFQLGVDFPIAREDFRDRFEELLEEPAEDLRGAFQPDDYAGTLGGYAFDYEGNDLRTIPATYALGRPDLWDWALTRGKHPWLIQNRERLAAEIEAWRPLLCFETNAKVGFSFGDSYPLRIFVRSATNAVEHFDDLRAVAAP